MSLTTVDVCNLAMDKLGAPRVSTIDVPVSQAERLLKTAFPHYRDIELRRRPWHFALETATLVPLAGLISNVDQPYQFELPAVPYCLRPLRQDGDTWAVYGRKLRDYGSDPISLTYISRPDDFGLYDEHYCQVLAVRLAIELCEPITQSTGKLDRLKADYKEIVVEAGRLNAFMTGHDLINDSDIGHDWVTERYRHG